MAPFYILMLPTDCTAASRKIVLGRAKRSRQIHTRNFLYPNPISHYPFTFHLSFLIAKGIETFGNRMTPSPPDASGQAAVLKETSINPHHSLPTYHYSPLTTHYSSLTTHLSQLTSHYSPLTTHHSLLTTHYSLLHFNL